MAENISGESLTKEEVRKMVHAAVQVESDYEKVLGRIFEDDEVFVGKILTGATEEEKDRYFEEFPEYRKCLNEK